MLNYLYVDTKIRVLLYQALIQSVLSLNLLCDYGNGTQLNRDRLERIRWVAQRIIGQGLSPISFLFDEKS